MNMRQANWCNVNGQNSNMLKKSTRKYPCRKNHNISYKILICINVMPCLWHDPYLMYRVWQKWRELPAQLGNRNLRLVSNPIRFAVLCYFTNFSMHMIISWEHHATFMISILRLKGRLESIMNPMMLHWEYEGSRTCGDHMAERL